MAPPYDKQTPFQFVIRGKPKRSATEIMTVVATIASPTFAAGPEVAQAATVTSPTFSVEDP